MKQALIVGCCGQDGRLLRENLSQKGYRITGIARPAAERQADDGCLFLDIQDPQAVATLIRTLLPDEIYHLAAFHHSSESLSAQENEDLFGKSFQVHVFSLVNFLEAMRSYAPKARLFYAASSHCFGNAAYEPQNEETPFQPTGVYGITKTAGIHICRFYRNRHGLFASTGILYNHESPLRKPIFVTKKIISGAVGIVNGRKRKLVLGNMGAEVDWGYAPDYVEAFHRILKAAAPDDFIVATGKKHTVQDFVETTFGYLGMDWRQYIEEDRGLVAPKGATLVGDPRKLMRVTGWRPSVNFRQMIKLLLQGEGISFPLDLPPAFP
jgi:GDPmannose 4,6-dehydratase